jgi:hypothetical protein
MPQQMSNIQTTATASGSCGLERQSSPEGQLKALRSAAEFGPATVALAEKFRILCGCLAERANNKALSLEERQLYKLQADDAATLTRAVEKRLHKSKEQ